MLMEKLPSFMVNSVIEAEEKLAQNRPTVHFVGLHGIGVSDVVQTVEKFARATPKEVTPVGAGAFLIRFDNVAHAQKMLKIDGRKIAATDKKIVAKQTDLHLPTEHIFRLVESKLLLREKSEAFRTAKDFGGANSNRQSGSEKKEKRV